MAGVCAGVRGTGPPDSARAPRGAVLVRVLTGQIPRDSSPAEGQIVAVDVATAADLIASGAAVLANLGARRAGA